MHVWEVHSERNELLRSRQKERPKKKVKWEDCVRASVTHTHTQTHTHMNANSRLGVYHLRCWLDKWGRGWVMRGLWWWFCLGSEEPRGNVASIGRGWTERLHPLRRGEQEAAVAWSIHSHFTQPVKGVWSPFKQWAINTDPVAEEKGCNYSLMFGNPGCYTLVCVRLWVDEWAVSGSV